MSGAHSQSVSVVIPVLNAEPYLDLLLATIFAQKPSPPDEVVLMDSMSKDRTREIAGKFPNVRVIPVPNFSHGGTRNQGAREATGELVVLMTQDAIPKDDTWQRVLLPIPSPLIMKSMSCAMRVPKKCAHDCRAEFPWRVFASKDWKRTGLWIPNSGKR